MCTPKSKASLKQQDPPCPFRERGGISLRFRGFAVFEDGFPSCSCSLFVGLLFDVLNAFACRTQKRYELTGGKWGVGPPSSPESRPKLHLFVLPKP